MPRLGLTRDWWQKCQEILKCSQISVAKKILVYKLFLRPMLIFDWFEEQTTQIKVLEMKALRQIFGTCSKISLYQKYTDIDVASYIRLQGIRWHRKTGSRPKNLRRMFHTMSNSPENTTKYFSKAELSYQDKKTRRTKSRCAEPDTNAGPSRNLRRSRRIASRDIKISYKEDQAKDPSKIQ